MVNTTILLDTRKIKKDGTYPIIFRIYYQGKTSTRSTKIYVNEKQWDEKKKLIRKIHPNSGPLNKRILREFSTLQSELVLADGNQIEAYLNPKPVEKMGEVVKIRVFDFVKELITELRLDNKIGNAWVYESALNALKKYHLDENLYFEGIDFLFLDNYNKHLLRSGVT